MAETERDPRCGEGTGGLFAPEEGIWEEWKGYGELRFGVRPGHPRKAVTSISHAEALAHGLTHLHHLVFAAVLARELDWCAALQDAREDARPWGVVGIGLRSDVWVEVRRDDHRPAVLVTRVDDVAIMIALPTLPCA